MSKFSVKSVESLDYDFTGLPREDGEGYCSGRGMIPEPSESDQQAFAEAMRELFGTESPDDEALEEMAGGAANVDFEEAQAKKSRMIEAISGYCKGHPSAEELAQLYPRHFILFAKWLTQEITDPNVRSAATAR